MDSADRLTAIDLVWITTPLWHQSEAWNLGDFWGQSRCLEPRIKVMRKRPKMSANAVSGLLAYTMELFVLYKIGVVAAPMVHSELIYRAFSDGLLDLDFRLVGHQVWREIQIMDMWSTKTTTTTWIPCWCHFCKSWLLALFRALLWHTCHHFQLEHVEL